MSAAGETAIMSLDDVWIDHDLGLLPSHFRKPGISYRRNVRPSVRPSVTRSHCVKVTKARITRSSPTDSPITLVLEL